MAPTHHPEKTLMNAQRDHHGVHYVVSGTAVGIDPDVSCDHGDAAVTAGLHGTPCKPGALPAYIETLIPRCGFADIVGTVLAQIRIQEGLAGTERFLNQIRLAETKAFHELNGR